MQEKRASQGLEMAAAEGDFDLQLKLLLVGDSGSF